MCITLCAVPNKNYIIMNILTNYDSCIEIPSDVDAHQTLIIGMVLRNGPSVYIYYTYIYNIYIYI